MSANLSSLWNTSPVKLTVKTRPLLWITNTCDNFLFNTYKWLGVKVLAPLWLVTFLALIRRVSLKSSRALDMITGTGAATFPTSSSLCIIFLIRACNKNQWIVKKTINHCWIKMVSLQHKEIKLKIHYFQILSCHLSIHRLAL